MLGELGQLFDGTALTCDHSPTLDKPQCILAAAWCPGSVTCTACKHLLYIGGTVTGSDETNSARCDHCGNTEGVFPTQAAFRALTYLVRLCPECQGDLPTGGGA